jgi:hypothetical protein
LQYPNLLTHTPGPLPLCLPEHYQFENKDGLSIESGNSNRAFPGRHLLGSDTTGSQQSAIFPGWAQLQTPREEQINGNKSMLSREGTFGF